MKILLKILNWINLKILNKFNLVLTSTAPKAFAYKHIKRYSLYYDLVRKVKNVEGVFVECGVHWGRGITQLSHVSIYLRQRRKIYGFDTFS